MEETLQIRFIDPNTRLWPLFKALKELGVQNYPNSISIESTQNGGKTRRCDQQDL
jgi:hypothetical protein